MSDLPRGTDTFLFTDIEGSTALWERDRQAMAAAVERHIALLNGAIQAHSGVHFKTVGDAVQAAFPTAPHAVAAAVEGQRALMAEDWGGAGPLRVRMALHAGDAVPDARGDYLAAPLNRLSRLLSTGYGGQILLSQTAQQLTRGALPAGVELQDLGEHRLRDLLDPERVFQLLHRDLPTQFPPLTSLDHRPHNLPLQPTPFLGRERQVGEVMVLLRRPDIRLLTLIGPGGTGKTRLGLQVTADLLEDFPDGAFLVSLAPVTNPALVPSAIAEVLGVREEGGQPLRERLQEYLAAKQVLLVLDNVEHLVADVAPLVGKLLSAAPGLRVLATSRVPLRLQAEHEYPVPPLGLPRRKPPPTADQLTQYEAVRLFIARATAVKPDFAVDNATAPTVAEICHRLDGLPLAIELAAARIRMLSPQAMLTRLEQRLPLLTGGARDLPARQQTLRNTIAWSYDLLTSAEQTLFRRLAVFTGGGSFDAVEAVANPEGSLDIFGGLERLVEHNLVRQEDDPDGQPRFSMLETVREFGLEQPEAADEAEERRQRHADYWLAWVEQQLSGPGEGPAAWDRVERDVDNLRAALAWAFAAHVGTGPRLAGALGGFWFLRGYWHEGRQWLEQALAWAGLDPGRHADLADKAGLLAYVHRDYPRAETLYADALRHWRTVDDRSRQATILKQLCKVALERDDLERASTLADEALTLAREVNDLYLIGAMLAHQGYIAHAQGDEQRATALLEESLATHRQTGDTWGIALGLMAVGFLALAQGEPRRAARHYAESLPALRDLGDISRIAEALWGVGCSLADGEDPRGAARLLGTAQAIREALGRSIDPDDQVVEQRAVSLLRAHLGEAGLTDAVLAGRALAPQDAIVEALALANTISSEVSTGQNG